MIHICRPKRLSIEKRKWYCLDCKQHQDFMIEHFEWYGASGTCLFCGGQFIDNEWLTWRVSPRVSRPSVRYTNIQIANKKLEER